MTTQKDAGGAPPKPGAQAPKVARSAVAAAGNLVTKVVIYPLAFIAGIVVDRKVLSDLAINEPAAFQAIAEKAKAALAA